MRNQTLQVGDRVAVYDSTGPRRTGRIEEVGSLTVDVLLDNGNARTFWPQQVRRLKKKRKQFTSLYLPANQVDVLRQGGLAAISGEPLVVDHYEYRFVGRRKAE